MKFEFPTVEIKHFELEDILTASTCNPESSTGLCLEDFSACACNTSMVTCITD